MRWFLRVAAVSAAFCLCLAHPYGAPRSACSTLKPGHTPDPQSQGNGGYLVSVSDDLLGKRRGNYIAGKTYRVSLIATSQPFKGFILQARESSSGQLIGSFTIEDEAKSHRLSCSGNQLSTVTHRNPSLVTQLHFNWSAPIHNNGMATIRFSVVQDYSTYWVNLNAADNTVPRTLQVSPTSSHHSISCPPPPLSNSSHRLTASLSCHSSCSYRLLISTNEANSSFLDITLEGNAQGWLAVGFTKSPNMYDADVMGCLLVSSEVAPRVVDTWNPKSRHNFLDLNQDGICPHSASIVDGRMKCSFSRYIPGTGSRDLDLNGDYYFLMGTSDKRADSNYSGFPYHNKKSPTISSHKLNPVTSTGRVDSGTSLKRRLVQAHGVLMIIAWPLLGGVGLFFAAFMRSAMPKGWFKFHMAFMISCVVVTAASFVLIFVANKDSHPPGLIDLKKSNNLAHFILGIKIMVLALLNPVIAIFRPNPKHKYRWIFNLTHGKSIGYTTSLLALSNIGVGLSLYFSSVTSALWVHVALSAFLVLKFAFLHLSQYAVEKLVAIIKKDEDQPLTLMDGSHTKEEEEEEEMEEEEEEGEGRDLLIPPKPIKPSKYSPLKWAALVFYVVVDVTLSAAIIALILK